MRLHGPVSDSCPTHRSPTSPERAGWRIERQVGEPIETDRVVMATGGVSVPNTGSDGGGLTLLAGLGHTIHRTYPALTPITAQPAPFAELAGVSARVSISARDQLRQSTATGGFLFTHRGYSGPCVLDVSHVVARSRLEGQSDARLTVRWTDLDEAAWEVALTPEGTRTVGGVLRRELPDRLADALAQQAEVSPSRALAQLTRQERRRLIDVLVRGSLPWTADEGYKKAEVTGGGVNLAEIDPRTMESKLHPGLFLCGELLDAFGPIGGAHFLSAGARRGGARGAARAQPGGGGGLASPKH